MDIDEHNAKRVNQIAKVEITENKMTIDMNKHSQYLNILPEINATKYYGESTKLIRQKLDYYFNKYDGDTQTKLFEVEAEIVTRETRSVKVEAIDEKQAFDLAREKLELDTSSNEEVEVLNTKEIK